MIDKVQKIREEIVRLQKRAEHNFGISLTENERQFWLGELDVLTLIGRYIESLLKEPASEQNISNVERIVKNWKESASEDLEEVGKEWLIPQLDKSYEPYGERKMMELTRFDGYAMLDAVEFGAKWHKGQLMAKAVDAAVHIDDGGYPYIPQMELYDYEKDIPLAKRGDKYKVILIKEE